MDVTGPACFRYDSPVYFDELDPLAVLHNTRFGVHVERAQSALFEELGYGWTDLSQRHEDINYVVRAINLEFTAPVACPGTMTVEVVALQLGRTSATWGYRCATDVPVAHGTRVVVKADATGQPVPWTEEFRILFDWLTAGAQGRRP